MSYRSKITKDDQELAERLDIPLRADLAPLAILELTHHVAKLQARLDALEASKAKPTKKATLTSKLRQRAGLHFLREM